MRVSLVVFEDCHAGNHAACTRRKEEVEEGVTVEYVCICPQCHG